MVLKLDVVSRCGLGVGTLSMASKRPVRKGGTFLKCPDCKGGYKEFSNRGTDWQIGVKDQAEEVVKASSNM